MEEVVCFREVDIGATVMPDQLHSGHRCGDRMSHFTEAVCCSVVPLFPKSENCENRVDKGLKQLQAHVQ